MKIINKTKNSILADKAVLADRVLSRVTGLLRHKTLKEGEGLVIKPCNSIHTFFMRFAIDVIFVGKDNLVVGIEESILPWRLSAIHFRAKFAAELPSGTIKVTHTSIGDTLELLS